MNWQLNKIQYPVYNLGPGKRIGVWVQGCNLVCKGCVNQTTWSKSGGKSVPIVELFNWIVGFDKDFDGITITGGEPFQQYEQLVAFLYLVKTRTNYDTYCFSGYYLKELSTLFPDKLFCRYLDFLVDGRYVAELHDNKNIKGSSNQTVYRFVDGIPVRQTEDAVSKKWSVHLSENNQIYMAGIPKKPDLEQLCSELSQIGIEKNFK